MKITILWLFIFLSIQPALHAGELTLDDFEQDFNWEIKEWGDGGTLSLSRDHASDGTQALKIQFDKVSGALNPKGIVLRRSLMGRAREYREVSFDVYVEAQTPVTVLASVEADQHYEAQPIKLHAGWNRDIRLPLNAGHFKTPSADKAAQPLDENMFVGSLMLSLQRQDNAPGIVYLDHIRAWHRPEMSFPKAAQEALGPHPISIKSIEGHRPEIERFKTLELTIGLAGEYLDPYDAQEIELTALLKAPDGTKRTVLGFLYAGDVSLTKPVQNAIWKIRLTPDQIGSWTYQIVARNRWNQVSLSEQRFSAKASNDPGFVRVDPKRPEYFSFDSGLFYYPLGQNLAWLPFAQYAHYFKQMAEQKENWARIWMSSWSFGLEWKPMGSFGGLGIYNLEKAALLDQIVDQADHHDIKLQLVFDFHGAYSSKVNPEWSNNPYNRLNGGFLARAEDFFTDESAKQAYKKRLRYIVARWGYSPSIMAWELFNEVSYTDNFKGEAVTAWHDQMARYIKSIDPHQHLITTSYGGDSPAGAYQLASIDFAQNHVYTENLNKVLKKINQRLAQTKKPFFIGEFGSNAANGGDDKDKAGVFLHAGLWNQFMQNASGNAMPWWWDSHIEPNNLYYHFGALARFAEGLDRRKYVFEPLQQKLKMQVAGKDYHFELIGLSSPELSMFWISDAQGLVSKDGLRATAYEKVKLAFDHFKGESYELEYWDTYAGKLVKREQVRTQNGRLEVELPYFVNDLAMKIRPAKALLSSVSTMIPAE